ncbi:hypothetical protein PAMP_024409 [Pampus punctatissimus]
MGGVKKNINTGEKLEFIDPLCVTGSFTSCHIIESASASFSLTAHTHRRIHVTHRVLCGERQAVGAAC